MPMLSIHQTGFLLKKNIESKAQTKKIKFFPHQQVALTPLCENYLACTKSFLNFLYALFSKGP
jgi:hypothetical protein